VNASGIDFTPVGDRILFGLSAVRNLGEGAIRALIEARNAEGPFRSLADLCDRIPGTTLNRRAMESLIHCGALDGLEPSANRAQLMADLDLIADWAASRARDRASGQGNLFDLFGGLGGAPADAPVDSPEPTVELLQRVVEGLQTENADLRDKHLRAVADAQNIRRRAQQDIEKERKFGIERFARDVLSVADNLGRALSALPANLDGLDPSTRNVVVGVQATQRELQSVLERHGVTRVEALGKPIERAGAANPYCGGLEKKQDGNPEDTASVGVHVKFGQFAYANFGDMPWNQELALLCPSNRVGTVDVLEAPGHGREPSTGIYALAPRIAV